MSMKKNKTFNLRVNLLMDIMLDTEMT